MSESDGMVRMDTAVPDALVARTTPLSAEVPMTQLEVEDATPRENTHLECAALVASVRRDINECVGDALQKLAMHEWALNDIADGRYVETPEGASIHSRMETAMTYMWALAQAVRGA